MTDFSSTTTDTRNSRAGARSLNLTRRVSSETKASFKTTETHRLRRDRRRRPHRLGDRRQGKRLRRSGGLEYVTFLTIGYMVSRGLAKSGSRDFYDDSTDSNDRAH